MRPSGRIIIHVLLIHLAVIGSLAGQGAPGIQTIPLGIYDRDGHFVEGIKPEQLRLKSVAATVRSVEPDAGPRRIILLLDISASMAGYQNENTWLQAKQTAKEFLAAVQRDDWISFHVFATKHEVLVPFTQDVGLISQRIDALPVPGRREANRTYGKQTMLADSLASILEKRHDPRFGDAVVLVSDGEYEGEGQVRLRWLKPRLAVAGLRMFLLYAAPPASLSLRLFDHDMTTVSEYRKKVPFYSSEDTVELTRIAGGYSVDPWGPVLLRQLQTAVLLADPEPVRRAARAVYGMVRKVYRVDLQTLRPVDTPHKLELEALDQQGRHLRHVYLTFPRYLAPVPQGP